MKTFFNINGLIGEINMVTHTNEFVVDSGIECVDRCPHENKEQTLRMSSVVLAKLQYLQDSFPNDEFLVYGDAKMVSVDEYMLNDIVIPEQKVGAVSVDDIKIAGTYNTVIHKHPSTHNHNFSRTDEEFVNSNHMFSILIGRDTLTNITGRSRIKMECNRYMNQKLKIVFDFLKDVPDTFKDEMKNIKQNKSVVHSVVDWLRSPAFGGGKANP